MVIGEMVTESTLGLAEIQEATSGTLCNPCNHVTNLISTYVTPKEQTQHLHSIIVLVYALLGIHLPHPQRWLTEL